MSVSRAITPSLDGLPQSCEAISPRAPHADQVTFPGIDQINAVGGKPARRLKVCIVTEDIVGPVRNGGIGTTYTHLSFLLADAGHDVTIFYPRGNHSEIKTIGYWIKWYRKRGVRFVPLQTPKDASATSERWLLPMLAVYDALKNEDFDLVHVSEWRGLAYLCLLAKKQGLAFQKTLFCMKTSSPYLWNREFMLEAVGDHGQLVKMFAERRSVELADMVIGGSRHLLIWMMKHGYKLPENRTYVQPNVAVFAEIDPALMRDRPTRGTRVPISEVVFFGRLEGRKGLDVFCHALRKLHNDGVKLPKVTFLGKPGARIATSPELTIPEYIKEQASAWGVEWQIIDNYQQAEAITYLLGEGRLAVMPSVIENSSLTVYEATHFSIPFVASNCGGNPELVADEHCDAVLTPTHPVYLSEKLQEAFEDGGFVAAPSFDNDENLEVWRDFHKNISTVIDEASDSDQDDAAAGAPTKVLIAHLREAAAKKLPAEISVCLVLRDSHVAMSATIESLRSQQRPITEVILVNDGSEDSDTLAWLTEQESAFAAHGWQIFDRAHYGTSDARNFAAQHAKGNYVLFLDPGTTLQQDAIKQFVRAVSHSGADVMLPFHTTQQNTKGTPKRIVSLKGDPCFPFFNPELVAPALLVKRDAFDSLGGFTTDYMIAGDMAELLTAATLNGMFVETIPEALAAESSVEVAEQLNHQAVRVRSIRPYMAAAPLCLQPMLLAAAAEPDDPARPILYIPRGYTILGFAAAVARHGKGALDVRLSDARAEFRRTDLSLAARLGNATQAILRLRRTRQ